MCNDVQRYDRHVYLRASEAQRCRVNSTLVMPVFDDEGPAAAAARAGAGVARARRPVAVFEVVQSERDVEFPEMMATLKACLQVGGA
jgi:nucleolar complex protein 2